MSVVDPSRLKLIVLVCFDKSVSQVHMMVHGPRLCVISPSTSSVILISCTCTSDVRTSNRITCIADLMGSVLLFASGMADIATRETKNGLQTPYMSV